MMSKLPYTALFSLPQAIKSLLVLSPTKFFSLVWPVYVRLHCRSLVHHCFSVLSVEADTSWSAFRNLT